MTINSPAAMIFAMYLVVAEQQGADWQTLSGTIQNDILKEFIAQKEYIFPPRPSMRIITDIFAFCAKAVPRWNTISVSGYHIREAGATAVQELAFTLRDGLEYVQWGVDAGLDVDDFVPRMSFFFNAHSDFFEEIAKYRAARRIWARAMRDRFGAQSDRSLEAAFPQSDGRRVAHRAAAVQQRRAHGAPGAVGGARRHQLAPHELARRGAGAADQRPRRRWRFARSRSSRSRAASASVVDPLGGSYFVEKLTKDMEDAALDYFDQIDAMGGMVEAIERGFPQKEIAESAYRFQQAVERKQKIVVGVNDFIAERRAAHRDSLHRRIGRGDAARRSSSA